MWQPTSRWLVCGMVLLLSMSNPARATDSADVYLGAYVVGGFFEDRTARVSSTDSLSTTMHDGVGAGLRVSIFPEWTKRIVGVAVEYFGTSNRLSFTQQVNAGVAQGSSGLLVLNSMANLVVRYPTGPLYPYIGFGIGYSSGVLHNQSISGRSTGDFDSTAAFAYQFMLGLQGEVTDRVFVFAEYKRLAADFHWNGFALDVRANYVVTGVGLKF